MSDFNFGLLSAFKSPGALCALPKSITGGPSGAKRLEDDCHLDCALVQSTDFSV